MIRRTKMEKNQENEIVKVEIETADKEKAFKRFKNYVMGFYKLQAKKTEEGMNK